LVHPGRDLPRCPSLRRRDTTDPGCIRSGGREPGPGRRLLPLRETERDAVIVGDSIVRHVRATLAEGKVHTHCLPGARVLDVSAQIPAILKADESPRAVVLHAGVNDTTQRQTETLKMDFRSLIKTVRSTMPAATIIVSGPLPTYRRGHERLFRADGLHPSRVGAELLSDNISRTLRSI
uniref:SGNH hydrolase-type esterase domain-containing protein n=1 Tax=Cyprinus carpio carpio TaxID=630221 RepID=A0A9J7XRQ1_CYPCA